MTQLTYIKDATFDSNTVLTVGSFDGVHVGHVSLIEAVASKAKQIGGRSVIITFDPHPRDILNPGKSGIRYLSTIEERCIALSEFGIDELIVIPFDRDFSLLSSSDFIELIYHNIGVNHYVIGYDHHFGKNRSGGIEELKYLAAKYAFEVQVIEEKQLQNQHVSSTIIRKLIEKSGDVEKAKLMLGRLYSLEGVVIHGDQRGRLIGFPTANLKLLNPKKIVPLTGVYAIESKIASVTYKGMMNIGVKPTFGAQTIATLEAHLFDFNEMIYGSVIEVRFIKRIRDEQKFKSVEALQSQLKSDKSIALEILNA